MNEKAFFDKYMPLIGKKVQDDLFDTKRLTKTTIFNKWIDLFVVEKLGKEYKEAKDTNNYKNIVEILEKCIYISEKVLGMPKNQAIFYNPYVLPFSLGNSKIGKDTLCISINSGLLCYMALTGQCSNCKICYAKASNKMYHAEFKKNTLSQIHFLRFHIQDLIKGTIEAIYSTLSKKEIENIKFLRINVNGDLLNDGHLMAVDKLAEEFIKEFGLISAYTYTHNKELDLTEVNNIIINCSDFFASKCRKSCLTIFNFNPLEYNEIEEVLCNGHCFNCPYCKSEFETRTVLFMAHGGTLKGLSEMDDYFISYLEMQKEADYLLFMRQKAEV